MPSPKTQSYCAVFNSGCCINPGKLCEQKYSRRQEMLRIVDTFFETSSGLTTPIAYSTRPVLHLRLARALFQPYAMRLTHAHRLSSCTAQLPPLSALRLFQPSDLRLRLSALRPSTQNAVGPLPRTLTRTRRRPAIAGALFKSRHPASTAPGAHGSSPRPAACTGEWPGRRRSRSPAARPSPRRPHPPRRRRRRGPS